MVSIPFSSGPRSLRPLHHGPAILGGPTWHGLVSLSQTRLWSWDQIGWFSVTVVSVCLPSDALSQHLPSYLGFSYLGCELSLHGCSSKAQPLLLTLEEAPPDLERGVATLGPPAPAQPLLLGLVAAPLAAAPDLGCRVAPLGRASARCAAGLLPLNMASGMAKSRGFNGITRAWASMVAQTVKSPPAMEETWV